MDYRIQFKPYRRKFVRPMRLGTTYFREREGGIVRLVNETGNSGFGECAPLPGFLTENLEDATTYCRELGDQVREDQIEKIPATLPCLRFAIESAQMMADSSGLSVSKGKLLKTAALLISGDDVIDGLIRLSEEGFTTFKWKIGVEDMRSEEKMFHRIIDALPPGGRLRLDANGGLNELEAARWLELLDGCGFVEFLEQPLPVECLDRMRKLAETHSTAIALDELAAGLGSLKQLVASGWNGPLVVKTSIVGSPKAFLDWSVTCPNPLAFSSGFETAIGFQAGLFLASKAEDSDRALGFGTNRFFQEDGLSLHGHGPELNPSLLSTDDYQQLWARIDDFAKPISQKKTAVKTLLLCEKNPLKFQQSLLEALDGDTSRIFLTDPDWGLPRWKEVLDLVRPDEIIGSIPHELPLPTKPPHPQFEHYSVKGPLVMIPTGGSTGGLRFAVHSNETLSAAVDSFVDGFGIRPVNSFCILPLHHVSGMMQLMRAEKTGGRVVFGSHKQLLEGDFPDFDPGEYIISLVSLQLHGLLEIPQCAEWLARFKLVLLGGGKVEGKLLETARNAEIRLAPSYGLTETAAVTVALTPEEFLSGAKGSGRALPGTEIRICDEAGYTLEASETGRIHIRSKSLCLGYFPNSYREKQSELVTGDQGFIDAEGSLHVKGRLDRIIITGGEKVDPADVEAAILSTGLASDAFVFGMDDPEWGQKVAALVVPLKNKINFEEIKSTLKSTLAPCQIPKIWREFSSIPLNKLGKIDREKIEAVFRVS